MLINFISTLKKHKTAYLFLLPTVILVLGFLISPIFSGTSMSLYKARLSGEVRFVGLRNFTKLFNETRFLNNLRLSFLYVFGNLLLSTPLAYAAALLITQKNESNQILSGNFSAALDYSSGRQFIVGLIPCRSVTRVGHDHYQSALREKCGDSCRSDMVDADGHSA